MAKKNIVNIGACCCGSNSCSNDKTNDSADEAVTSDQRAYWILGKITTPVGDIPKVATKLIFKDILGSWKARWGVNRMNYMINPGLYCVGNPDSKSAVLVTANYKMSFDSLRKELGGLDAWIMVLDTKGINVWCAAGKGTFGTEEVVGRIEKVELLQVVSHRTIVLPQLGAPGVAAHEVLKRSGFKVVYGPVRASDIMEFIKAGMKATQDMRTVKFTFVDRIVLTPVELSFILKPLLIILGVFIALKFLEIGPNLLGGISPYIGAVLVGNFIVPALLPWIPGRAFSWKGWIVGIIYTLVIIMSYTSIGWGQTLVCLLVLPSISAFVAMNFTGSSTYTSLSGVVREMKIAVPAIIASISAGVIVAVANLLIK